MLLKLEVLLLKLPYAALDIVATPNPGSQIHWSSFFNIKHPDFFLFICFKATLTSALNCFLTIVPAAEVSGI